MAPVQDIVWIALPNGFGESGQARLSVFVSPRLDPGEEGILAPFDFLDWPSLITSGTLQFGLGIGGAVINTEITGRPESRLWASLFGSETFVRPYVPDATSQVFGSYPAAHMHDLVKAGYQEVAVDSPLPAAAQVGVPEKFAGILPLFGPIAQGTDTGLTGLPNPDLRVFLADRLLAAEPAEDFQARLDQLVDLAQDEAARSAVGEAAPPFVPLVPSTREIANTFAQFVLFHRQPAGTAVSTLAAPDTRLDFHQRVSALAQHPALLRLLGLVIDLDVDPADIPAASGGSPGVLRVIPRFAGPTRLPATPLTPGTAYVMETGRVFAAAPGPSGGGSNEIVSGLLNLSLPTAPGSADSRYRIIQVDVDGAGLRTLDLLARTARSETGDVRFTPSPLRSCGLSVARHDAARDLHEALSLGRAKMAAAAREATTLFQEDLLRGYRVDIGDPASGRWLSLHERDGAYRFSDGDRRELSDEGWVESSFVQPNPPEDGPGRTSPDPDRPNYLGESLFVWQGWSMSARRPGQAMPEPPAGAPAQPTQPPGVEVEFTPAEQSLPRLRFGHRYQVRARTVDLAGNGVSLKEADRLMADLGTAAPVLPRSGEEFRFLRFEVVPSPVVVSRTRTQEGESPDRIVLRSDHDVTPEVYTIRQPKYRLAAERHIAPPPTWHWLAETHGLLDASIGTGRNHERFYRLAARGDHELPEKAVFAGPSMPVTYLPDPLAAGASLWNLPGVPEGSVGRIVGSVLDFTALPLPQERRGDTRSVVLIDFGRGSAWPDLASFRLRLAEGSQAPEWDRTDRVLTVFLPKGQTRNVRLSSHLAGEPALELLGIWDWTKEELRGRVERSLLTEEIRQAREAELRLLSLLGLSRMITPCRELTLVHAVQRPAGPPPVLDFTPARVGGTTFAFTRGRVQVHGASTGSVELAARWTEQPGETDVHSPVFSAPVQRGSGQAAPPPSGAPGPVPAASYPEEGDVVEFPGPAVESVGQDVNAAVKGLQEAIDRLTGAVEGVHVPVEELARTAREGIGMERPVTPGPAHWRILAETAATVKGAADSIIDMIETFDPHEAPPGVEPPQNLVSQCEEVGRAAIRLQVTADRSTALLQRFQGRHEFGDTKYRRVHYQAVAATRFGECFGEGLELTRESNVVTVDMPSSMWPAPPQVSAIVPAFAWTRTSDGTTRGSLRRGALRVYLAPPWYATGNGEQLGVLVAGSAQAAQFLMGTSEVTRMGRDPLWRSSRIPQMPTPSDFRNAAVVNPQGADPRFAPLLLVFDVERDRSGRCYCDIELSPGGSYYPFVQLVLVRYQAHSLPGLTSSAPVLADFAQLAPDRAVSLVKGVDGRYALTVSGVAPIHAELGTGNRIRVTAQERLPGTIGDVGWLPASGQVTVTPDPAAPAAPMLWSGTVTAPEGPMPNRFRLLIEEMETHRALSAGGEEFLSERVIFVETILI
ncbi:hypothetical protein [Nonomuraea bangladeshensis]|uniref:hypothetical protein n=1 Tax=Nonomuraea bangladeshensis TaxID=404385 RepID=UPI003C2FCC01